MATSLANTASLSTDFNVSPYYDDFNETKNFHRILFQPGLAVQARELTQLQTILQNQIDRFGEHIFKEGSVVRGGEMNYDRSIKFVKIKDADINGVSVNAAAYIGSTITGNTSGATAYIIDALDGSEANDPDLKTFYVRYTGSGANGTVVSFSTDESLHINPITATSANSIVANTTLSASGFVGTASRIHFNSGILFGKDHFIRVDAANTIVGRYNANTDIKVGYTITESIVTSASDTTLLDPSQGAYNYAAPGANRLKLLPTLTTKALSDTSQGNFIERVRIKNGDVEYKADLPLYAQINEYIARRTFDESGDYIVNGLYPRLREHLNDGTNDGVYTLSEGGDSNKLSCDISPGKAYVKGYELDKFLTSHVVLDKATDVDSPEDIPIITNYGNYAVVDELAGTWDLNGHDKVTLYDSAFNAVSNNTLSASDTTGRSIVGTARVRAIDHVSGTQGAATTTYNMYLYDINMTANSFSYAKSAYFDNSTYDGFGDFVLTNSKAVLKDGEYNRALFELGAENIKTLKDSDGVRDNSFKAIRGFTGTDVQTAGTYTLALSVSGETYTGTGSLNSITTNANYRLISNGTANSASAVDSTASRGANANTITGLSSATDKWNVGDKIQLQGEANTYIISSVDSASQVSVYGDGEGAALSSVTAFKYFSPGQIISLSGVGGDGAVRTSTVTGGTSIVIDLQETLSSTLAATLYAELNIADMEPLAKTINENRYVEINVSDAFANCALTGPWPLGLSDGHKLREVRVKTGNSFFTTTSEGTDVTNQFTLDGGMTDNLYDHAKLKIKETATHSVANGNIYLVKFDYFTHEDNAVKRYMSVDSYSIDVEEIPVFTSPVNGNRYDLRNHIDVRPRITDTANSVTTLTNISRTPATSIDIIEPTGGLRFVSPGDNFTTDYQYYLPRKDLIAMSSQGQFEVIKGTPQLDPKTPNTPADSMQIAVIDVKPYPSLPQDNARKINTATAPGGRVDLGIKVSPRRIRRFTMKDIQGLEERIDNLEYYTSLSLLESDTKNLFIANSTGADRFKNGLIVDQFIDFTASDYYNEGYKIAIDKLKKEARPSYKIDDIQLEFLSANSTNVTATSKDATITIADTSKLFANGVTITQGAVTGKLDFQVDTKLYLSNTTGTFTTTADITGGSEQVHSSNVSSVSLPSAGKLVMLPWYHDTVINQPFATDTRNLAGLYYSYKGVITLNPETDYWNDTTTTPSVQIDFGEFAEALQEMSNFVGVNWGGFSDIGRPRWTGNLGADGGGLQVGTVNTIRTGEQLVVETGGSIEHNLGDSVQNVNMIPYMRSRIVQFTAQNMKPSTRVYPFFDDTDVSSYCSPTDSSFANTAIEGSALITDSNGLLYGNFRVPADDALKFTVGNKIFRLTDSATNSKAQGATTTYADGLYSAHGLNVVTQGTIISTREIEISTRTVSETGSRTTFRMIDPVDSGDGMPDPVCQTFKITDVTDNNPGSFLTKICLFFQSKSSTLPLQVEIREIEGSSQLVTEKIVPLSRVIVPAADINISTDGSKPTPIIFETPVYLLKDTIYALTLIPGGNNPDYAVWTARLGEDDKRTGNRVTEQPSVGILFASSNDSQWVQLQEEDLKFRMYFGNYSAQTTGTAIFKNRDKEFFTLANTDSTTIFSTVGETVHGETTLTMTGSVSANIGFSVRGNTSTANGIVTYNSGSTIRLKEVTTANKFTDGETVLVHFAAGGPTVTTGTISTQSTPTGKVYFYDGTTQANTFVHISEPSGSFVDDRWLRGQISGLDARINTVENLNVDEFKTTLSYLDLLNTTTTATAKIATSSSALDTAFRKININNNTGYNARRYILSRSNEVTNLSSAKSGEFSVVLTRGAGIRHSPAIDNDRTALIGIENLINNDSTNEDSTTNGNAQTRYITKTITLADGQDAEDLKVFLGAYKPATANINVYVKLLNGEDGQSIADKTWLQLTQSTSSTIISDSENLDDFKEYEYAIPTANLTGASDEVQYTSGNVTYTGFKIFKIKIVLLSTSTTRIPRIKDFRTIAIQV